jgi:hypothetical protein
VVSDQFRVFFVISQQFLPAFKVAFTRLFTVANIYSAFRGADLVLLQPDVVLSQLDIQLRTPTATLPIPAEVL